MSRPPKKLVVKYGGNAMKTPELRRAVAGEIATLRDTHSVIVVHGGGPVIEHNLARLGIESQFLRGLRVTTPEALEVIEASITSLGKTLAAEIGNAIGLTGRDVQLLIGERLEASYGRVGQVVEVNTQLLETLNQSGLCPVIGCIAVERSGEALNVNADWAAGAVAGALTSDIIFLTDVNGVRSDPTDPASTLENLSAQKAREMIEDGQIQGGMIPKVEAALYALHCGAQRAIIASGMTAGILADAVHGKAGTALF